MAVIKNKRILKCLLMMVVSLLLVLDFSIGVSASSGYDRKEADACITISERLSVKGGSESVDFDINKLTRSQQKAIKSANNTINDHLKESDISAAIEDLKGNPIEKPGGGYWNHAQEVKDAYPGLIRAKNMLSGSLNNPNLTSDVRSFIQSKCWSIKK